MNILILGSGGREHALAWAIKQNPKCDRLICAPGNAGMALIADCAALDVENSGEIRDFVVENAVDFVVIGPEAPLAAGVSDDLRAAGILTFGPSQAAAMLETSKSFTKEVCVACRAPTAAYGHFSDLETALEYLDGQPLPIVIKADGLAAGKGVVIAATATEARDALVDMFAGAFGQAGAEVVIEEFMEGEEASLFVLADGLECLSIGSAQDHKRACDGDTGPNTGGMGAYSPAPVLTAEIEAAAIETIIRPTLAEMVKRGTPYQGVLYAGLMIREGQARLVEYNVRFGDPECQVLMMRLGAQVLDLLLACAGNRLPETAARFADDHAITVVMAAAGYPGAYEKGSAIRGIDALPSSSKAQVFHAGTERRDGRLRAAGGRVLNVSARGASLAEAHARAYQMVNAIDWPEGVFRTDIGWRAL